MNDVNDYECLVSNNFLLVSKLTEGVLYVVDKFNGDDITDLLDLKTKLENVEIDDRDENGG